VGQRLKPDDAEAGTEPLDQRLRAAGRGIILLHDPKAQTAAMLPAFLRYLRDHDFRVVHVVPTGPGVDFEGTP
jgi:peptidoglycan/xylan/chitin deacetylase (PgdA/CDA1 family)